MKEFIVREILNTDIESEIRSVGFDEGYAKFVVDKYDYKNLKIFNLTAPQVNILKQTALSLGADCATHREVITCNVELSNCILGGSVSTLKKIAQKLEGQPFGLKFLKSEILSQLETKQNKTKLVGVLNLTQNSFSDGGKYWDFEDAKNKFLSLIDDGAVLIDIGAESTRPLAQPVSAKNQLEKIIPILEFAKSYLIQISIDTRSSEVADEVLKLGDYIINDVSGLEYDSQMLKVLSKHNANVIIQHWRPTSETIEESTIRKNLIDEIYLSLNEKINIANSAGLNNIIIDPGIGFGKTKRENIEIIKRIGEFKNLNCPVMLGISRKSFLGVENNSNELKDALTLGFNALAINAGVDYLRVHNVKLHKQFINTFNY